MPLAGGLQHHVLVGRGGATCFSGLPGPATQRQSDAIGMRLSGGTSPTTNSANSSDLLNLVFFYGTSNNNGSVLSQTIVMPKQAGGTMTLTKNCGYDGVNRCRRSARRWRATMTGWPPGSDSFVKRLEGMFVRKLARNGPAGRKRPLRRPADVGKSWPPTFLISDVGISPFPPSNRRRRKPIALMIIVLPSLGSELVGRRVR